MIAIQYSSKLKVFSSAAACGHLNRFSVNEELPMNIRHHSEPNYTLPKLEAIYIQEYFLVLIICQKVKSPLARELRHESSLCVAA